MDLSPNIVNRDEWLDARRQLLVAEKELTRRHDRLAEQRRSLPWVRVQSNYRFETTDGTQTLPELFGGRTQLLVYHFMYGEDWDEGCPSCSFWADNFNGVEVHLAQRDVTLLAVSRAPLAKLLAYRDRMGWSFPWVSSHGTSFNVDFGVSDASTYNYAPVESPMEESPGLSAFIAHEGEIFHTYSTFGRGLDVFNGAYQLLDLAPKGRDEANLAWSMAWLRRRDSYLQDS